MVLYITEKPNVEPTERRRRQALLEEKLADLYFYLNAATSKQSTLSSRNYISNKSQGSSFERPYKRYPDMTSIDNENNRLGDIRRAGTDESVDSSIKENMFSTTKRKGALQIPFNGNSRERSDKLPLDSRDDTSKHRSEEVENYSTVTEYNAILGRLQSSIIDSSESSESRYYSSFSSSSSCTTLRPTSVASSRASTETSTSLIKVRSLRFARASPVPFLDLSTTNKKKKLASKDEDASAASSHSLLVDSSEWKSRTRLFADHKPLNSSQDF